MKFKVWVEIATVQPWTEETVEVPDDQWSAMTEVERDTYMKRAFEDLLSDVAGGGYEEIED